MKPVTANHERQMSSEKAFKIIKKTIADLPIKLSYRSVGNKIRTYQCKLVDLKNSTVFFGCGKGIGIQSQVSATFEAYEHYLSYAALTNKKYPQLKFMKSSQLENLEELVSSQVLPLEFKTTKLCNTSLPWLEYKTFNTTHHFYYPLFLVEPRYSKNGKFKEDKFDYSRFSHLSCDSGTASGTSFTEAAIHGLNECVERDAISLFLINTFIKLQTIYLIDKATLPKYLQHYIQFIEAEFQDDLAIADITSEIGIPTFCVSFTRQNSPIQPLGFGTSLNKSYALERALLEALQPLHLRNRNLDQMQKATLKYFRNYPLLKDSASVNISQAIIKKQVVFHAFQETEENLLDFSLESQLKKIIQKITNKGYIPRYSVLNNLNSPITCLKILVPGFDNFFLVTKGKFVMPNLCNMIRD